jgi:hypothetical protein
MAPGSVAAPRWGAWLTGMPACIFPGRPRGAAPWYPETRPAVSRRRRQRYPHPHGPRRPVCGGGARRRRAQGHERSRRYEPPRCPHAPRLTPHPSPECTGAWPQPCMCTRGLAVPARRSTLVTRGAARSVAATHTSVPAQETPARRPVPNALIARRRRRPRARTAQEPPPSRYGSPAARRPATRQEQQRRVSTSRSITGKRPRGRREEKGRGAHSGATV